MQHVIYEVNSELHENGYDCVQRFRATTPPLAQEMITAPSTTYHHFFSCTHTDPSGSPSWCLPDGFLLPGTSAHPPPSFEGHPDLRTS